MAKDNRTFWKSLPGILTGIAGILTALTGIYLAFWRVNPPPVISSEPINTKPVTVDFLKWTLIADETFSDNHSGWNVGLYHYEGFKNIEFKIVDGKYRWDVEAVRDWFQYYGSPFESVVDFYASVRIEFHDTTLLNTDAGLAFGSNPGSGYLFMLSPRKVFDLCKATEGGKSYTSIFGWTPVNIDMRSPIELSVLVENQQFKLYIKSKLVASYRDALFTGGKVGLYIGTFEASSFTVDFDDFIIRQKP